MLPGVLPNILLAAEPTATTLSVLPSMATTEGSESTIPCPLTNTSVFAVPRSIATSRPNSPPNIRVPSCCSNSPARAALRARLEHPVLPHTKVPVAQDHVVEHLNSDNFRGARQALGDLAVLAARFYSAARVVVREHDARRARPDGRLEDLPRVNKGGRERADRDCRELYDFVLGV